MARQLLIQFTSATRQADANVAWLLQDDGRAVGNVVHGSLTEAAQQAGNARVIVIVPGEMVYLTRQHLPGRNRQRLVKAIPFALEDQLIDDVEDMHFALGIADRQGQYWIAAVRHEQMELWRSLLLGVGLNPQVMIPDVLLFPSVAGELRLLCEPERTLLALPDQEHLVIDNSNLAQILKRLMLNTELNIGKLECYSADRSIDLDASVAAHVSCEVNAHSIAPLLLLGAALAESPPINLLQGRYSRREKRHYRFEAWYPAAAMLAVWIVAKLVIAGIDNFRYSSQLAEIHRQQQQVYQQAFPTAKARGDVYRNMESQLKELKQRRGAANASFYHMLSKLAPTLGASGGLQVQVMRYHEGQIELEVHLPTLQSLDQLKSTLVSQQQWQVDIQSATSAKNHVEARMQIRSRT